MNSPLARGLMAARAASLQWMRLPDGAGYALGLALAMRLALSAMAAWLLSMRAPHPSALIQAQYLGLTPLHDRILAPWQRFDAFWYLRIATHGYGAHDGSTVYYPLYPLLIRLVSLPLGGNDMLAALLVSNLCFAALLVALFALVASRYGTATARRAVAALCLFPTASFLLGAYTESLFLMLAVGVFLALDRKRCALAGVLAFLAALTRVQGVVLMLPLLCAAAQSLRFEDRGPEAGRRRAVRYDLRPWLVATTPPLAAALFMIYVRLVVHGGFIATTFRERWFMAFNPPWVTLAGFWTALAAHYWRIFAYPTGNWVDAMNLILALGVPALVLPARRLLGTPLWLYALATWLVTLTLHQSTARYMLTVFPALIVLAVRWPGGRASRLAVALCAPLMLFVAAEFVMWSFVG